MGKWLLAILLTHAADPRTDLVFVGPEGSTVAARFEHLPDASVHGRLLGRTAFVVADRAPGDFGGALLRIENGKVTPLCDGVYHASTPLIADGRVFVERGRPGVQGAELRVDELTIDEWTASGLRTVFRGSGYTAHLAGYFRNEIIVYFPSPGGAPLLGVDRDSGRVRTIVHQLHSPVGFRVDGERLYLLERARWIAVDLVGGALEKIAPPPEDAVVRHGPERLEVFGVELGQVRQFDAHIQIVGFVK